MKETYHYLKMYIKEKDTVVAAISGGPDSMALLSILLEYRKENPIQIICAHVNHNIRKESDSEEAFVKEYCLHNDVIFESVRLHFDSEKNFENEAHHKRYQFFDEIIQKYNATILLTAHHGDDLMESILLKLTRGSSLKGYKGFDIVQQREHYAIVRPLFHETKETILEYNQKNNIPYVTDVSNFEDIHTRNRIRKYMLPLLKRENPKVHDKFIKFHEEIRESEEFISSVVRKEFEKVYQGKKLNIELFLSLSSLIQRKVVQLILEEIYLKSLENIQDKHVEMVIKLAKGQSGKQIHLPNSVVVSREYNFLCFEVEERLSYIVELKENTLLPNGHTIEKGNDTLDNSNFICRLNKKDIKFPLYIRTRKKGDKMQVKNMRGTKNINTIFKDCKVPLHERETYPILVDNRGTILWVPGLKKSNFDIEKDEKCDIILRYN